MSSDFNENTRVQVPIVLHLCKLGYTYLDKMERFEKFCSPLRKLLYESNMEIIRLIKIRDELLPILMNGQVNIK